MRRVESTFEVFDSKRYVLHTSGGCRILKGGFRSPERFRLRSCARTRLATHAHKTTKRGVPRNPRNPPGSATAHCALTEEERSSRNKALCIIHAPCRACFYYQLQVNLAEKEKSSLNCASCRARVTCYPVLTQTQYIACSTVYITEQEVSSCIKPYKLPCI